MGHGEQIFRLFPGQPVPQPSTLLPEGDVGQVRGLFDLFTRTAAVPILNAVAYFTIWSYCWAISSQLMVLDKTGASVG
jgi:hypothetical protein